MLADSIPPVPSYFCQIPLNPCASKTAFVWISRVIVGVLEKKIANFRRKQYLERVENTQLFISLLFNLTWTCRRISLVDYHNEGTIRSISVCRVITPSLLTQWTPSPFRKLFLLPLRLLRHLLGHPHSRPTPLREPYTNQVLLSHCRSLLVVDALPSGRLAVFLLILPSCPSRRWSGCHSKPLLVDRSRHCSSTRPCSRTTIELLVLSANRITFLPRCPWILPKYAQRMLQSLSLLWCLRMVARRNRKQMTKSIV